MSNKSAKFDYKSIKTFEDACKEMGMDPCALPNVSFIAEEHRKSIIAYYKLIIIFQAINNGWRPDWSDSSKWKHFPWYYVLSSGFGFDTSDYLYAITNTTVGSRLCTETSEKALYIAKQFEAEYRDYLLYSE